MSTPTLIPQSSAIVDAGIQRILSVFPLDSDGDHLIQIREGDDEAGIYIDARGVQVLLRALGSPAVERDSNPNVRAVAEAVGELDRVPAPEDLDWNETAIAAAVHFEKAIKFAYDKGEGVIEQRTLYPKASYAAPNGIVVVGDDPDRNDVRAFRLDRIQGEVVVV